MVNEKKSVFSESGNQRARIPMKDFFPVLWDRFLDLIDTVTGRARKEDEYLAKLADEAHQEFLNDPKTYSLEEVRKELGIDK